MSQESIHSSSPSDIAAEQPAGASQSNEMPPKPAEIPKPREIGGPTGPEPTRYGDWEKRGRCIDF